MIAIILYRFISRYRDIEKMYENDEMLRAYVARDSKIAGRVIDDNQIRFILEETLLMYLILKGNVRLRNEFTAGHEKWILFAYPGKPLFTEVYIFQQNPFNLDNDKNVYQNSYYDLEEKKLYDFSRIDLGGD